jgi:hypothetical protein
MPVTPFSDDDEGISNWLQRMLGAAAPGSPNMGYPAQTNRVALGGTSMGYPAQGGSALAPYTFNGQVGYDSPGRPGPGPETRGYLEPPTIEGSLARSPALPAGAYQGPGGPEYLSPQSLADLVRNPGRGITTGGGGAAGGAPGLGLGLGAGNPALRGALAAAGVMAPSPAETGELQRRYWPSVQDPTIMAGGPGAGATPVAPFTPPEHPHSAIYPSWPTPPAGVTSGGSPASTSTAPPHRPVTPTPAAAAPAGPVRTPGAPNLGYYNPRFVPIDRPNMDAAGGARRGGGPAQMTALNLAGLFGGGQPNPANVPSAAAQPVSATRGGGTVDLPTNYNLPGSGYYMTPAGDVGGTRYPSTPAGATPTLTAYQQWLRARGVKV